MPPKIPMAVLWSGSGQKNLLGARASLTGYPNGMPGCSHRAGRTKDLQGSVLECKRLAIHLLLQHPSHRASFCVALAVFFQSLGGEDRE
jgi:hypothetical protein